MSRTYKDAPFDVKKKRSAKNSDSAKDCSICVGKRIIESQLTAIFYAHEIKEIESFVTKAEEIGFEVERNEVTGYLGSIISKPYAYRFSFERLKNKLSNFFDSNRAVYSEPRATEESLLWDAEGNAENQSRQNNRKIFGFNQFEDDLFKPRPNVSKKKNIFVTLTVSEEIVLNTHCGNFHNDGYRSYHECRCDYCSPDEKSGKNDVRMITNEIRKSFNSGNTDDVENTSELLTKNAPNAYRDWKNC